MQTKLILLLSLSLTLGAGAAAAVPSECDNVLLTKNISRARQSNQVFSAWLSLIDVSNYGKIKQDASADVPGYFSGDYQSFDEKRRRYLNQQASTFTSSNARETLSSSLPEQAIPAWRACVASHSSGLFAYPVRGTRKSVDVVVGWRHPPGLANPGKLEVAVNGRTLDAAFPSNFEGKKNYRGAARRGRNRRQCQRDGGRGELYRGLPRSVLCRTEAAALVRQRIPADRGEEWGRCGRSIADSTQRLRPANSRGWRSRRCLRDAGRPVGEGLDGYGGRHGARPSAKWRRSLGYHLCQRNAGAFPTCRRGAANHGQA